MDWTKSKWQSYTLRIEKPVYEKLRVEAFRGKSKISRLIRLAVNEYIERHYGRKNR